MRSFFLMTLVIAVELGTCLAQGAAQPQQAEPAAQLIREVLYNELSNHQAHGYWRYWIQRHTPKETLLEDQIETSQGPITRLALNNGHPLSLAMEQQEHAKLMHLLSSREEQARHLAEYEEDEQRIGRVLALLPEAFIFQYASDENDRHKLTFRPDPAYSPHNIEARVFHSMSGTLWVDGRMKRLARLDAHVEKNLDFGFGILGRLYKGGWFQLQRVQVSATEWKTERLEMHMAGRALLVKSFARETSETRGGFAPVPAGMNLAQGLALMEQTQAQSQAQLQGRPNSMLSPTALALKP